METLQVKKMKIKKSKVKVKRGIKRRKGAKKIQQGKLTSLKSMRMKRKKMLKMK